MGTRTSGDNDKFRTLLSENDLTPLQFMTETQTPERTVFNWYLNVTSVPKITIAYLELRLKYKERNEYRKKIGLSEL